MKQDKIILDAEMVETRWSSGSDRGTGTAYIHEQSSGKYGNIVFPIPSEWSDIDKTRKLRVSIEVITQNVEDNHK